MISCFENTNIPNIVKNGRDISPKALSRLQLYPKWIKYQSGKIDLPENYIYNSLE